MKDTATKAMYAMVGAPMVAYEKTVAMGSKLTEVARSDFKAAADKGERVTKKVTSTNLADELGSRVDLEGIQGRVEKLRDQLEDALSQWRENFRPGDAAKVQKPVAPKPAAKAPAAGKKPVAKATAAKATSAKKAAAKKPAAKTSAARKPAAKAVKATAAKSTAAKSTAAKRTAAKKPATAGKAASK